MSCDCPRTKENSPKQVCSESCWGLFSWGCFQEGVLKMALKIQDLLPTHSTSCYFPESRWPREKTRSPPVPLWCYVTCLNSLKEKLLLDLKYYVLAYNGGWEGGTVTVLFVNVALFLIYLGSVKIKTYLTWPSSDLVVYIVSCLRKA